MERARLGEIELEYEVRGTGEPVMFIHPGIFTDWFTPLFTEPDLKARRSLVHYHRVGCAGSSRVTGTLTLSDHAAHACGLMHYLGIDRAHVVGHSSSGNIALQLALDAPELVQSLAIFEPALMSVPAAATSRRFVAAALQSYQAGDPLAAVDIFLRGTCGSDYRNALDRVLPGAFDRYVADATTFFEHEFPALQQWSFRAEDATRIQQPTLAVVGEGSLRRDPIWGERHQLLLDWLANVEPFVLPAASLCYKSRILARWPWRSPGSSIGMRAPPLPDLTYRLANAAVFDSLRLDARPRGSAPHRRFGDKRVTCQIRAG